MYAGLVPSQSRPDPVGGFTAADLRPARAKRHGHATEKNVSECDRALVSYGFDRFGHDMTTMPADRLAETLVKRCCVRDGQRLAPMPLGHDLCAALGNAGFRT